VVLPEAEWRDMVVSDCKLDLANFRQARLVHVRFERCVLTEADFGGAHLSDVTFDRCDLTRADFSGLLAGQVSFPGSTLVQLSGLRGLAGCSLTPDQIIALAPELAAALGIKRAG
jgi:uncharacterized protein YjbI with pentapeptide repeats